MLAPQNGIELKSRRTVNSKHYDVGGGKTVANFGAGHQHYWNKNKVGDGAEGWRGLDWTLTEKDGGGWTFLYHSFNPDVPEYADGWLRFRDLYGEKDQTVGFRAVCSHVRGRVVPSIPGLTDANAVVYDDAFGKGVDYVVYFTRSQMLKCVRIREKEAKDYSFRFELELPEGVSIWRSGGGTEYELDATKGKDFDTGKRTELRTANGATFFRPFMVWDSEKAETCRVTFSVEGGKTYLTKRVGKRFMEKSSGDVFTDTSTSYYAGAGDGDIYYSNASWSTTRAATSGTAAATANRAYVLSYIFGGNYYIYRSFLPVDTSGLPDSATISAATLYIAASSGRVAPNACYAAIIATTQAATDTLGSNDYDNVGSTRFSADTQMACTADTYMSIAMNSTGIAAISATGYTKIGLRTKKDLDNTTPSGSSGDDTSFQFYLSENTGTSLDPYVSITYTSGPANVKTVNGLAIASVKTVNGLATSSIKSINGLT